MNTYEITIITDPLTDGERTYFDFIRVEAEYFGRATHTQGSMTTTRDYFEFVVNNAVVATAPTNCIIKKL